MACLWQLACQADCWHIACKMNKLLNAWQKRERVFHIVLSTMIKQEIWTRVTEKLSLTLQNALKQTKDLKRYCRFWSHRKEPCVFGDEMFLPKTRSLFLTKPTFAHIVFNGYVVSCCHINTNAIKLYVYKPNDSKTNHLIWCPRHLPSAHDIRTILTCTHVSFYVVHCFEEKEKHIRKSYKFRTLRGHGFLKSLIVPKQYHDWWCHADARSHSIYSDGTDLDLFFIFGS